MTTMTRARKSAVPTEDGFYTFTSEECDTFVKSGSNFRDYNPILAEQYASDMERRGWPDTGDAIVFANGELLNGQHRIGGYKLYLERGGKPLPMRVVVLADKAAEMRMDCGRSRTVNDYIRHAGCGYVPTIAALVLADCRMAGAKSQRFARSIGYLVDTKAKTTKHGDGSSQVRFVRNVSLADAVDRFRRYRKDYEKWAPLACSKLGKVPRVSVLSLSIFAIGRITDVDMAMLFMDQLGSGENLKASDPIYHLRNLMLGEGKEGRRHSRWWVAAVVCKAWNYWIRGQDCQVLRWKAVGPYAEEMPEPVGKED